MNTGEFIKKYCKPTICVASKDSFNEMINHLVDQEAVREYLIAIDYDKYLQTLYWKAISKFIRSKFKKCKCGSIEKLLVHHKTYKYAGIEHLHPNSLEVMCSECHEIEHKKINAPCSKDRGLGYEAKSDSMLKKFNKKKSNAKRSKPLKSDQNTLIFNLLVKHKMKQEIKIFGNNLKLPKEKQLNYKAKYVLIKGLLSRDSDRFGCDQIVRNILKY